MTLLTWKKKKTLKRDQLRTTSTGPHTPHFIQLEKENVFDKLHNESEYIFFEREENSDSIRQPATAVKRSLKGGRTNGLKKEKKKKKKKKVDADLSDEKRRLLRSPDARA